MIEQKVELPPHLQGKWAAVYLPTGVPDRPDPTKLDFDNETAALDYVYSSMCRDCKEGRQRILDGTSDPDNIHDHQFDSLWPACACEWEVLPTESYARCEGFNDIMEAVGAQVIWSRE